MPTRTTISASCCGRKASVVEAEAAYRAAIRARPDHSDAFTNLGILLNGSEADAGSGRLLLQGHHLQAEAPRSSTAAGAGALHPRRGRRGGAGLRRMARGGAGQSHRPAHDRGVLGPRCSGTGIGRLHRTDVRQFRRQLRGQARQAVVPRPGAGRGDAGGRGRRSRRRPSTCSMPDAAPGCADRSSRRTRAGWWESTCPRACWRRRRPSRSTTSWSSVN